MDSEGTSFHFVGAPVAHRTPRVAAELWEKHRKEVTELYLSSKSLDDVVAFMQDKHEFLATKQQYVYQLRKWGVKKLGLGNSPLSSSSVSTPPVQAQQTGSASPISTSTPSSSLGSDIPSISRLHPLKRHRDAVSITSVSSTDSSSHRPPRKKTEMSSPPTTTTMETTLNADIGNHVDITSEKVSPTTSKSKLEGFREPSEAPQRPIPPLPTERSSSSTSQQPRNESPLSFPQIHQFGLQENGSRPQAKIRLINHDQPPDSFKAHDMANIERAADLFDALGYTQEAFELYTTIFKRNKAAWDSKTRDVKQWYCLLFRCVHNISNMQHFVVTQNIIRAELKRIEEETEGDISGKPARTLLMHMLLAVTYSMGLDHSGVSRNIEFAKACANFGNVQLDDLLLGLPDAERRSLGLSLYINALRLHPDYLSDLESPVVFGSMLSSFLLYELQHSLLLEDCILRLAPGPFELQRQEFMPRMMNPCLQSCLDWCNSRINVLGRLPHIPDTDISELDGTGFFLSQSNSLFLALWEDWQSASRTSSVWMSRARDTMGISPTELLMLVCRAICHAGLDGSPPRRTTETELLEHFRKGVKIIVTLPHTQLARIFLREYISHHTISSPSSSLAAFCRAQRRSIFASLGQVLGVGFPRLGITLITHDRQSWALPPAAAGHDPSPTLAGSYASSDRSRFQKTGTSAAHRLQRFARGSFSIPSTFSLPQSGERSIDDRESVIVRSLSRMSIAPTTHSDSGTSLVHSEELKVWQEYIESNGGFF